MFFVLSRVWDKVSIYIQHEAINIADPSSMQDTCHMNYIIDLANGRVSVTQRQSIRAQNPKNPRFNSSWVSYELRNRSRSRQSFCDSEVKHCSTESKNLRFNSSSGLRIFSLSYARDKMKKHLSLKRNVEYQGQGNTL